MIRHGHGGTAATKRDWSASPAQSIAVYVTGRAGVPVGLTLQRVKAANNPESSRMTGIKKAGN